MIIPILGFAATFLVVFVLYLGFSKAAARRAERKERDRLWEEGQRRRSETSRHEDWDANKRMPLK
jgi:hypothetical protein